jgi:hypothetical protein
LEVVGDPSYSLQLRKKIMDIKDEIHKLEEEKRKLANEKFVRERKMNKVIMAGQPDAMQEIQDRVKELTVLFDRVQKLNRKLEFQATTKEEADRQLIELSQKLNKLEQDAETKGINIEEIYSKEDGEVDYDVSSDPKVYDRKKNVLEQAMQINQAMYSKKLEELKVKLESSLQEKNNIVQQIKIRHDQTIEKRKEVNDLMVTSKLVSEDEADKQNQTVDETLNDLPESIAVDEDEIICKLSNVLKRNKKSSKLSKAIHNATPSKRNVALSSRDPQTTKVPTTKNAFNLRKKGPLVNSDNEDEVKASSKREINDSLPKPKAKVINHDVNYGIDPDREKEYDEASIENTTSKQPIIGKNANSKPFGNKLPKPSFGGAIKQEVNNAVSGAKLRPF